MNFHMSSADDNPALPTGALASNFGDIIEWMLVAGSILCLVVVVVMLARVGFHRSQGLPAAYGSVATALVGVVLFGSANLIFRAFVDTGDQTPSETPADIPVPEPAAPTAVPVPDEPINWAPLITVGAIIAALLGLAVLGLIALRTRHQIADRKAAAADREKDWHTARTVFDQTRTKFADYLADPYAIFERPTLDDHTDTYTAAFLAALAAAEALHTETVPRSAQRIDEFRTAAIALAAAWTAADQHAREIGMGVLTPEQRKTLTTIERALAIALDESAPAGEREAAMRTVIRLAEELPISPNIDRIAHKLTLSIENAQRKALTI